MVSAEYSLWFLIGGIVILLFSSGLQSFWEFGRQARPDFRPALFETYWGHVILVGWVVLLLIGGVLLLMAEPIVALVAVAVYWLLLPLSVGPRVRRRALPPWDDLKAELEKEGFNEHNYWRRGDWWKAERKSKPTAKRDS